MSSSYEPEAEGRFIDRIYEAAVTPELWRGILVELARIADAKAAVLTAVRGTEFSRWIVSSPDFEEFALAHVQRFPANERTRRSACRAASRFPKRHGRPDTGGNEPGVSYRDFLISTRLWLGYGDSDLCA